MRHAAPDVQVDIDTGSRCAIGISDGIVEEDLIIADVDAHRRNALEFSKEW
jgi:hypothetical protein